MASCTTFPTRWPDPVSSSGPAQTPHISSVPGCLCPRKRVLDALEAVRDTLKRLAAFLDRDGVIIENRADYVKSWDEVSFVPGALLALQELACSPLAVVLFTNQSAVGRGIITLAQAQAINARVIETVRAAGGRIDGSYLCPHAPEAGCACRKPAPGLLLQAAQELALDLSRSWAVGDAATDLQAARAAGVRGILVRTGRGRTQEARLPALGLGTCPVVDDLPAAVKLILDRIESYRITTR